MNNALTLKAGQVWTGAPPRNEVRIIDRISGNAITFSRKAGSLSGRKAQATTVLGFRKWIQLSHAISDEGLSAASLHGFSPSREIGQRIQLLRRAAGLSQQAFADMLGMSRSAIAFWETGRANHIRAHVPRIARVFGISEEVFLNGQNHERTSITVTEDERNMITLYRSLPVEGRLQAIRKMEILARREQAA
ncbi:XRE family transcriptional regulator [Komagataeibacter medellinensis]|nr:XRE family transcriptional regulator [Komagataeibacter medellinensis]